MKKFAKIPVKIFDSPTYRAMNARYGAAGALLYVHIYMMCQTGSLPDLDDERQLLILAAEVGADPTLLEDMLADLRRWEPYLLPLPEPEPEVTEESDLSDTSDTSDQPDQPDQPNTPAATAVPEPPRRPTRAQKRRLLKNLYG